jgi:hypothetical protein
VKSEEKKFLVAEWGHITAQISLNRDLQYRELTLERITPLASGKGV